MNTHSRPLFTPGPSQGQDAPQAERPEGMSSGTTARIGRTGRLETPAIYSARVLDIELDRRRAAASFGYFVRKAWHVVEPGKGIKWGWALDAMADHLMAVAKGQIRNLLINVPPGMMKSRMCGVMFPAWEWGPIDKPHIRFLGTSHKQDLAVRDNLACRRLIKSEWYQERWPVRVTNDQNTKMKFENDALGFREAMAFTSMTGSRGDRVLLDDPHSVDQANSDAEILNVATTFREALPTRINDDKSSIIIIMQRLHEGDVSGIIIDELLEYEKLILPMHYDPARHCTTSIGFSDPRTADGELLFPERFSEKEVKTLEGHLGPYASAGQLEQSPTARGGNMFKREWFEGKVVTQLPSGCTKVRHWDLAASEELSAPRTAGVGMAKGPSGEFYVWDCIAKQLLGHKVRQLILHTGDKDGRDVLISLPQDPGQAGKVQKQDYAALMAGRKFRIQLESGDKVTRAEPFASQCEAGNVFLLAGGWNKSYIDELCAFPAGKFKDRVDASSGAFGQLVTKTKPKTVTSTTRSSY
jgi:predicted phage terminase large subunit-like protein